MNDDFEIKMDRIEAFVEAGGYNPWDKLGICSSYSSLHDDQAIAVLKGIRDGSYCTDTAKQHGMSNEHVELLHHIFCGAGWCNYGTSPRGCFPDDRDEFDRIIDNWEKYSFLEWGS